MSRVASLYLPALSIERLRRLEPRSQPERRAPSQLPIGDDVGYSAQRGGGWRPGARWSRGSGVSPTVVAVPSGVVPLVIAEQVGNKQLITAACVAARALGLNPGMTIAQARSIVPDLDVRTADPEADYDVLYRMALHAVRHWTPTAAVDGSDGLWLDLTGASHLHGGEERFCRRVLTLGRRLGFTARIAIAGAPGAAHALARFGLTPVERIAGGAEAQALAPLPLACLRLAPEALAAAGRFGLETVGDLLPLPRGPLTRRLGLSSVRRLDEALGRIPEPIVGIVPDELTMATRRLLEPIVTAEAIEQVIRDLLADLARRMLERGVGARSLLLVVDRIDGSGQRLVVGTVRATRDPVHLARLFHLRIERIEPGDGIETMRLVATHVEPLGAVASAAGLVDDSRSTDLAALIDRLSGRAGPNAVFTVGAVESDVPERAVRRANPLEAPRGWPSFQRPVRLLQRPEALSNVIALLPDHPPRRFMWRGATHAVVAGDGPERIYGEWWKRDGEVWAVRDYYRIEDETGRRFWLFRRGDGVDPATGDLSWYMHGVFG